MTSSELALHARRQIKKKLILSLIGLLLAVTGTALWPYDIIIKICASLAMVAYVINSTKFVRFFRAYISNDVEIISLKSAINSLNTYTTLPFKISGAVIVGVVLFYFLIAVLNVEVHKLLLAAGVLFMMAGTARPVIMFNYDAGYFYGLWKGTSMSAYDSDRQIMKDTTLEFYQESDEIIKVKITDKGGYYFIYKKDYPSHAWERILVNLNRLHKRTNP